MTLNNKIQTNGFKGVSKSNVLPLIGHNVFLHQCLCFKPLFSTFRSKFRLVAETDLSEGCKHLTYTWLTSGAGTSSDLNLFI